ncbi:MAG: tetratricopeptide repeat protein [Phycisphaerae bacterium]|jgi:tetratricopeptide (TPR) repeat protein
MPEQNHRYHSLLISICLTAAIIAVYWPVYKYDFIKYDDDTYITNNINIQSGLNFKSIRWAFATISHSGHYWHPVTWLSHTLDYQLFGNWAGGHHLINVLFHILNTLILFYVFVRMTGAMWPSAFVSAAFALHPLHVESVAWIAERKDVLSTFFWLLTMLTYVQYVLKMKTAPLLSRLCNRYYLLSIAFFVFGLMSKPMLVTVPFVLLLLDYWPLERKMSRLLLIEKIPFFIGSFACCIITFIAQQNSALVSLETFGFSTRVTNTIVSYVAYIAKMIWPNRLALLYPHPENSLPAIKVVICVLLLISISVFFIYMGRKHKFFIVGWFWYLGTLVPVIGLVQVGAQAMADRYTYMTLTGLFIIIAWSAKEFVPVKRFRTPALFASAVLFILFLTASRQLSYWQNSQMLFGRTIELTKNNYMILDNLGSVFVEQGKFDDAIRCFRESLRIYPDSPVGNNNLGGVLQDAGRNQEAIEYFKLSLKYNPDFLPANLNLANTLRKEGHLQEAVEYFNKALRIAPNNPDALFKLGITLVGLQKYEQAVDAFSKVIELEPDNVTAHGHRSLALAAIGKTDEAIKDVCFVLRAKPDDVMMYRNLGIFLERKGDIAGAIEAYRAGLRIDPDNENLRQLLEEDLKSQTVP